MDFEYLYDSNISLGTKINPFGKIIRGVKPTEKETFLEYNFTNALDFLDVFDVNKSELYQDNGNDIYTDYIYRGHKDSTWDLLPSVFRRKHDEKDDEFENRKNCYKSGNGPTQYKEVSDFALFIKGMDSLGLDTNDCSYQLIAELDIKNKISGINYLNSLNQFQFPKTDQLSELALAQHYGIKTRLLDFTENPFVALFFASESAFPYELCNNENKIGIWVIPKFLIQIIKYERYLEFIDVKKFQNKYIAAQKGVFVHYFPSVINSTEIGKHNENSQLFDITYTLDKLLTENFKNEKLNKLVKEYIGKPMLFTLPHNELYPIAKRLNQLNINWISLMPSLDGVQKEVERQNRKPFSSLI